MSEQEVLVRMICIIHVHWIWHMEAGLDISDACQGRGNSLHFVLNIKKALFITFDNVRDDEGFASIYTRVGFI